MKPLVIILLCLISVSTYATEKGNKGFKISAIIVGFFNSEVESAKVKSVEPDSEASSLGVKKGDKIIAIQGCKIPGCPADEIYGTGEYFSLICI